MVEWLRMQCGCDEDEVEKVSISLLKQGLGEGEENKNEESSELLGADGLSAANFPPGAPWRSHAGAENSHEAGNCVLRCCYHTS
ncbi:Os11g0461851 [Oryza sativa Japonica Group]|uniref:Os11g0461851 protein n=1 Tax=Oryza sativa subsp. japonica TaxID=39947 RepID=A0A0P0Y1X7_ORYSJ|nr:Os11g0461851 [Oryza sativa Japonica Group]